MAWTIINNSKTSITEYLTASYATSLSTLENALLTSITTNIVVTLPPFPPGGINLSPSFTSGLGINAVFNLVALEIGPITGITVTTAGSGYAVGNTITFTAGDMEAAGFGFTVGNLVITLSADDFGTDGSGGIIVPNNSNLNSVEQNIAGYPTGVISFVVAPSPSGLSIIPNALFASITQQTAAATPGTYSGVTQSSTSGIGSGTIFTIIIGGGGLVITITVTEPGSGYAIGDTITFLGATAPWYGGAGQNLIITLVSNDFIWTIDSTLEISIIGGIDTSNFTMNTLVITKGDTEFVQYVDWNIPLQTVALQINNNTTTSTGQEITISSIRMQTSSKGGGRGFVTSSGASIGPGGDPPQIQFNDGGNFGGTVAALYDKTANTSTGQIKLANGSFGFPILAFPDDGGTPSYNTGIYRPANNAVGISGGGNPIVGLLGLNLVNFIKGLNVGQGDAPGPVNICGIQRLSETAANSWEDGWMGNSSQLVFTGSDFTNYNTTGGVPQEFAVASADIAGGTGFVMGQTASADGNEIIAVKLLPKGFRVQSDATVSVATADQTPAPPPAGETVWNNTATIHLVTQDINIPTNPSSSFGTATMATWSAAGMNTDLTTVAASSVGNGTISVVIIITILNTIQIDFTSSLIGVVVPIERQ